MIDQFHRHMYIQLVRKQRTCTDYGVAPSASNYPPNVSCTLQLQQTNDETCPLRGRTNVDIQSVGVNYLFLGSVRDDRDTRRSVCVLWMYVRFGFWFQLLYDNERHLGLAYALIVWGFCSACGACWQMTICHSSTKRSLTEEFRGSLLLGSLFTNISELINVPSHPDKLNDDSNSPSYVHTLLYLYTSERSLPVSTDTDVVS